jgi:hypothetical protein
MTSERKQILEILAAGKVSAEEAERLIQLTANPSDGPAASSPETAIAAKVRDPKFILIMVEPSLQASGNQPQHHVNIWVPLKIVRAGVNLASLIPNDAGHMVQNSLLKKASNLIFQSSMAME